MTQTYDDLINNPEFRREYEEELLLGEAQETIVGLLKDLKVSQAELADRLGVTGARVSQILSGGDNLTLRSLADLGWAMGVRFELHPTPLADRQGTPALGDPPAPLWLENVGPTPRMVYVHIKTPTDYGARSHKPEVGLVLVSRVERERVHEGSEDREGVAA